MRRTAAVLVTAAVVAALGPSVQADPGNPEFYSAPVLLPAEPGSLIRSEPSALALTIPNTDAPFPGTATRLMYRSTDSHGNADAVTGTYIDPSAPWSGPGPRPLVAFAVGTHGQGPQCAPSRLFDIPLSYRPPLGMMFEYETTAIYTLLASGYAVVITDYEGLGGPGVHTYVNRISEAHAVLDSVRAARALPNTSISPDGPVGLWGYSQGGGASAAAAELAPTYAPEIDVAGAYVGAPPADLFATVRQIDGGSFTGAVAWTINGLRYSDPDLGDLIDSQVNEAGRDALRQAAQQCTFEMMATLGFHRTSEWTISGRPLAEMLTELPQAQHVLARNQIGTIAPTTPTLVYTNTTDDIVPHDQVVQLTRDWCARGADVELQIVDLPVIAPGFGAGHVIPDVEGSFVAAKWMAARFAGEPTRSTC